MNKPHKHADLIKAWADGASVQLQGRDEAWNDDAMPQWHEQRAYRIKPAAPREWWVVVKGYGQGVYSAPIPDSIHVREVTDADIRTLAERNELLALMVRIREAMATYSGGLNARAGLLYGAAHRLIERCNHA